jgi:hypothetical protein
MVKVGSKFNNDYELSIFLYYDNIIYLLTEY